MNVSLEDIRAEFESLFTPVRDATGCRGDVTPDQVKNLGSEGSDKDAYLVAVGVSQSTFSAILDRLQPEYARYLLEESVTDLYDEFREHLQGGGQDLRALFADVVRCEAGWAERARDRHGDASLVLVSAFIEVAASAAVLAAVLKARINVRVSE